MKQDFLPWVGGVTLAVMNASVVMAVTADTANTGAPTVYGRLDIATQYLDDEAAGDVFEVKSYASRVGVKGEAELSDMHTLLYQYELEIEPEENAVSNSSNASFLKARDQYIGLRCDVAGTFRMGRMDTPLKQSQGKVDLFNDHNGDLKNILSGENRPGDTFNYLSPKIADVLEIQASLIQGEDGDNPAEATDSVSDGIGDYYSVSAVYKSDGFYGAFAYDSEVLGMDTMRLTGVYSMDGIQLGALFQQGESSANSSVEEMGWLLSAGYSINEAMLKFQYGSSENESGSTTTAERSLLGLGIDYALGKKTTAYGEYILVSNDTTDIDVTTFGVGLKHNF